MPNAHRFLAAALMAATLSACSDNLGTAPERLAPTGGSHAIIAQAPIAITSGVAAVTVSTDGGATYGPAFATPAHPAWAAALGGGSWIASYANGSSGGPDGITTSKFKATFSLPTDFTNASVTVQAYADNWAAVSLNGSSFGSMVMYETYGNWAWNFGSDGWAGWGGPKPATADAYTFTTTSGFTTGENTLLFDLQNWGGPEGLTFTATVSYSLLDCPAAPAIAAAYLKAKGVKANSTTYGNIVAAVGSGMTQGAMFLGSAKCDADYASKVQGWIQAVYHI